MELLQTFVSTGECRRSRGEGKRTGGPWVRRVGFSNNMFAFALLPPSWARASFLLWGEGETLVREGGFCAMQENPKCVPMARPYASFLRGF